MELWNGFLIWGEGVLAVYVEFSGVGEGRRCGSSSRFEFGLSGGWWW